MKIETQMKNITNFIYHSSVYRFPYQSIIGKKLDLRYKKSTIAPHASRLYPSSFKTIREPSRHATWNSAIVAKGHPISDEEGRKTKSIDILALFEDLSFIHSFITLT
jgi:hypothetical protein